MEERGIVTLKLLSGTQIDNDVQKPLNDQTALSSNSVEEKTEKFSATHTMDERIEKIRSEVEQKVRMEYLEKQKKDEVLFRKKSDQLELKMLEVSQLISNIEKSFNDYLENGFHEREPMILEIVIEALYKVLGDLNVNESYVRKTIAELSKSSAEKCTFRLKVSEDVYKFLFAQFKEDQVMNMIIVDRKLNNGQMVFQDANCVRELGLVDRLDVVKGAFINQLRKSDELSSL